MVFAQRGRVYSKRACYRSNAGQGRNESRVIRAKRYAGFSIDLLLVPVPEHVPGRPGENGLIIAGIL